MGRCSALEVKSDSGFSYEYYCRNSGAKVGDDSGKAKMQNLCDCDKHYDCPLKR